MDQASFSIESLQQSLPQFVIEGLEAPGLPAVFSASSTNMQRHFDIYVVPHEAGQEAGWTPVFLQEVQTALHLQHPNLLGIEESGTTTDGQFFYVAVDKCPGSTLLKTRLMEPMTTRESLLATRSLALAMSKAHDKGIVHGRLSPASVDMADGKIPKILPVNIAPQQTDATQVEFYAPESLIPGQELTPQMDIYSLGAILYFMLTGKTPSGTGFEMPSDHCVCSEGVDQLTAKALHPDPAQRFATLIDFIQNIENILSSCEVKPRRHKAAPSKLPTVAQLSQNTRHSAPVLYFYLIPALVVAIALAFISILYRLDMVDMNEEINKLQEEKKEVVRHHNWDREKRILELRKETAKQEIAAASTKKAPPSEPVSPREEPSISSSQSADISNTIRTAPASTEGLVNWCSQSSNVRVQSNAPFKNLMAYKAENLIDGKTDSIAAANAEEDGKSWFSIDFGKNTEKTISMIVFRIPPYSPMLGKTSNFRIRIANSNNDLVAEKNFHTDGSAVVDQETWVLDAPVQARGLRIESLGKNQPLIIADLEVYGKP